MKIDGLKDRAGKPLYEGHRNRLRTRLERGEARAEKALYIQDHFDQAISAMLIGTNIVHISTATLVTVLVTRTWGAGWVALGTVVCTITVFFAGEMLPKSIGKRYSESCALAVAPITAFFKKLNMSSSRQSTTTVNDAPPAPEPHSLRSFKRT